MYRCIISRHRWDREDGEALVLALHYCSTFFGRRSSSTFATILGLKHIELNLKLELVTAVYV